MSAGTWNAADPDTFVLVAPRWFLMNTGGVVMNGVLAMTTKRRSYQLLFWGAVVVHAAEAVYSYRAAQRAGFTRSAPRWALQTLAVGFPSLLALRKARG
jgi:transmembrane protein TMEM254